VKSLPLLAENHSSDVLIDLTSHVYDWPAPVMVGGFLYLMAPVLLPQASRALTILYDSVSPSGTWPKTTCLPSSHEVTTVVTKNWEPLLQLVSGGRGSTRLQGLRVGSGVGHGQEEGLVVPQLEVLVTELLAVDGLAAGALERVSVKLWPCLCCVCAS
jgi:hypothetical protein